MTKEAEEAGERLAEGFKARMFASAFGSFDPGAAMKQYYKLFEEPEERPEDLNVEEFEPENADDVREMFNVVRRAGIVN